ncbi:histidinolphosphatase [Lunasporangiospora selenospora]|uniref:Histidinol-phosphatase n=1 Tax=Lunasporangiospora selenospora TaxID=979761 RepID=A0A9P6KGQ2_9FUNG|nr:histidinolphosphatase [Lunasporangiospora selenospora]
MHAKGTLEQVVESAIARNFTTYGLSEHMPRYKPEQLYPEESHLTIQDLEKMYDEFLLEASRLQSKFKSQICLLIGLETEYFDQQSIDLVRALRQPNRAIPASIPPSSVWTKVSDVKAQLPQVQYIVGSMHHIRGIPLDFSAELYLHALQVVGQGSWEKLFEVYFDTQYEMLQGLQPEVVGHLDLVRIFFSSIKSSHHDHHHHHHHQNGQSTEQESGKQIQNGGNRLTDSLWALVKRNVDYVISYGGLFELNSRAWKKGLADAYPQRDILEYILSKGGRVTLSDDSHGPDDVGMFYNPELKEYLERMNVEKVYYLAPNSGDLDEAQITTDETYKTNARPETSSFQHVHVRSIPTQTLRF